MRVTSLATLAGAVGPLAVAAKGQLGYALGSRLSGELSQAFGGRLSV